MMVSKDELMAVCLDFCGQYKEFIDTPDDSIGNPCKGCPMDRLLRSAGNAEEKEKIAKALKRALADGTESVVLHVSGEYGHDCRVKASAAQALDCVEQGALDPILGIRPRKKGAWLPPDDIGLITADGSVLYKKDGFAVRARFTARRSAETVFDAEVTAEQYGRILGGEPPESVVEGLLDMALDVLGGGGSRDVAISAWPEGEDGFHEEPAPDGYLLITASGNRIGTGRFDSLGPAVLALRKEMSEAGAAFPECPGAPERLVNRAFGIPGRTWKIVRL